MSLALTSCISETCDTITFTDTTGLYDEDTNPGGYGVVNTYTSPADFTSLTLAVWDPSRNYLTDDPIIISLDPVPDPDEDFHFEWEITAADLGLTSILEGAWYFEYRADDLTLPTGQIFTDALDQLLAPKMLEWDPTCPCKPGCQDAGNLAYALDLVKHAGICDLEKSGRILRHIRSQIKNCC